MNEVNKIKLLNVLVWLKVLIKKFMRRSQQPSYVKSESRGLSFERFWKNIELWKCLTPLNNFMMVVSVL